ncbi:hypothetical protein ACJX0J_021318, partial [Zea mays]
FCNIMSFDIFARGSSHIAWKQLMVMCRFLENSEVGNIGRVIIMFIHYQHNILVGITGGEIGSVGITGGDMLSCLEKLTDHGSTAKGTHMGKTTVLIFCFCAPRNYALCLSCVPGASC